MRFLKYWFAGVVSVLAAMTACCAGYAVHQVKVHPPENYPSTSSDGALTVGVDPLDSEAEVRAIFNTDLNKAGFLAVNVIIRNDGDEAYSLRRSSIFLVDRAGIKLQPTGAELMIQAAGTSIAKWYFISGVLGGISASRAKNKMRDDFINKELKDEEVPPGVAVFGFLYFQHQVSAEGAKGYKLIVTDSPAGKPLEVVIR